MDGEEVPSSMVRGEESPPYSLAVGHGERKFQALYAETRFNL